MTESKKDEIGARQVRAASSLTTQYLDLHSLLTKVPPTTTRH
jgi:hypothetical protein